MTKFPSAWAIQNRNRKKIPHRQTYRLKKMVKPGRKIVSCWVPRKAILVENALKMLLNLKRMFLARHQIDRRNLPTLKPCAKSHQNHLLRIQTLMKTMKNLTIVLFLRILVTEQ
ncbi:hypothetical protein DAPPUDRAFT_308171 [Daphnia pulex]|uniref:Uncharacterized protein n=1 Tax=Daphnia pulex TaxID=6669 RepID=E9H6P8_DAPPU|nr:hypothetical protein DAPPUDRAFT_308171 [Daphnia pulex]|eukprot:EFX72547.1 hypothetical protein DAPPUDRAFT_308171 [Daphnia pulex]